MRRLPSPFFATALISGLFFFHIFGVFFLSFNAPFHVKKAAVGCFAANPCAYLLTDNTADNSSRNRAERTRQCSYRAAYGRADRAAYRAADAVRHCRRIFFRRVLLVFLRFLKMFCRLGECRFRIAAFLCRRACVLAYFVKPIVCLLPRFFCVACAPVRACRLFVGVVFRCVNVQQSEYASKRRRAASGF